MATVCPSLLCLIPIVQQVLDNINCLWYDKTTVKLKFSNDTSWIKAEPHSQQISTDESIGSEHF